MSPSLAPSQGECWGSLALGTRLLILEALIKDSTTSRRFTASPGRIGAFPRYSTSLIPCRYIHPMLRTIGISRGLCSSKTSTNRLLHCVAHAGADLEAAEFVHQNTIWAAMLRSPASTSRILRHPSSYMLAIFFTIDPCWERANLIAVLTAP